MEALISTQKLLSFCKNVTLWNILVEKYNEEDVFSYNIGLGMILKFVKQALKLRISNVDMRKEQKEVERKKRDEIIAENDKTTE